METWLASAAPPAGRRKFSLFLLLLLVVARGCAPWGANSPAGGPGAEPADGDNGPVVWDRPRPIDPEVVALIDRLAEVADEGPGTHSTAYASCFFALDEEPQFGGGVLGSHRPMVAPPMRALVRMGVRALPDLLNHLSDPRPTKLNVGTEGETIILSAWHSNEYDPRHRDRCPPGVSVGPSPDGPARYVKGHTLRVGDLCFVAVGQIVNRGLSAVRYQPSSCMVINSPVKTPALADATRRDWAGLTRAQHRQSLVEDATAWASVPALKRLYFYYPEAAEPLTLKLLNRPWYDHHKVRDFVMDRLVKVQGPEEWKKLIAGFRADQGGPAGDAIPAWLRWACLTASVDQGQDRLEGKLAARILAELYPQFDLHRPGFINAASTEDQTALVEGLSGLGGPKVDEAVARVFRSIDQGRAEGFDRVHVDDLVLACLNRLAGKGLDKELVKYCETRIRELEKRDRQVAEDQRLEMLRAGLQRLRKGR
jgi:hypothetical protein